MNSGFYNIQPKGDLLAKLVFCDMESGIYDDVPQLDSESSGSSPLGTILAWIPSPESNSSMANVSLPEGWVPCDGSTNEKGPWKGAQTPDLNAQGHFLRGATMDRATEFQMDQMMDHEHEDPGHYHGCQAGSTAQPHDHSVHIARD